MPNAEDTTKLPSEPISRPRREIVSFVRRGSRLTQSRQRAWDLFHEQYVLDLPVGERETLPAKGQQLDVEAIFGRKAPLIVEVGSGLGENIAQAAANNPDTDFLAFEVYQPGLANTLDHLEKVGLPKNVRLLPFDAQYSLSRLLPEHSIAEVWVFLPDPWHKTRHHKRRIISPMFLDQLALLLEPNGKLRCATDWAAYAHHMFEALEQHPSFTNCFPQGERPAGTASDPIPDDLSIHGWSPRFAGRTLTSFERKGISAGRLIWELTYATVAA